MMLVVRVTIQNMNVVPNCMQNCGKCFCPAVPTNYVIYETFGLFLSIDINDVKIYF